MSADPDALLISLYVLVDKEALDWLLLRFRNFMTDISPVPAGPHIVVLDQPSPAPPARPTDDQRFAWLANRETNWYRIYQNAYEGGWRGGCAVREQRESVCQDVAVPLRTELPGNFHELLVLPRDVRKLVVLGLLEVVEGEVKGEAGNGVGDFEYSPGRVTTRCNR